MIGEEILSFVCPGTCNIHWISLSSGVMRERKAFHYPLSLADFIHLFHVFSKLRSPKCCKLPSEQLHPVYHPLFRTFSNSTEYCFDSYPYYFLKQTVCYIACHLRCNPSQEITIELIKQINITNMNLISEDCSWQKEQLVFYYFKMYFYDALTWPRRERDFIVVYTLLSSVFLFCNWVTIRILAEIPLGHVNTLCPPSVATDQRCPVLLPMLAAEPWRVSMQWCQLMCWVTACNKLAHCGWSKCFHLEGLRHEILKAGPEVKVNGSWLTRSMKLYLWLWISWAEL